MFYYLYKITNNINGKIYIGVHRTENLSDGYMGSGNALKFAKKKYGHENFTKEILKMFDNIDDMLDAESVIVNEDFVNRKDTYNIITGGTYGPKYPRETPYYKSGRHTENVHNARQLALEANRKLKIKRIDEYNNNPSLCSQCKQPLLYEKKRNKFCSSSCAASFNNKGRPQTDFQKQKARETLTKQIEIRKSKMLPMNGRRYCKVITKTCKVCQTKFAVGGIRKSRKTCSDHCAKIVSHENLKLGRKPKLTT